MVPSSYFLTKITSTKSRGEIIPIAAEGVTVLQTDTSWKEEEEMTRLHIIPQHSHMSVMEY